MSDVTVVIPVGPSAANQRWLDECLESVYSQTLEANEIVLIDDTADLIISDERFVTPRCWIWQTPWRSGVANAFNFGIGLAKNDLVFMLGSDDYLAPNCLEQCINAWEKNKRQDAYYYVGVEYLDDRQNKEQFTPCNAAMVTKGFWEWCGGFPPETASGAPDAALVSMMWGSGNQQKTVLVNGSKPLYYCRTHQESDTAKRGPWQGVILQTRHILTEQFIPKGKSK